MPLRDEILERVTVESATITAGRDGDQWKIMLKVPSLHSQYPTGPCWFAVIPGQPLIKQEDSVVVRLRRGRLKKDKNQNDCDPAYEYNYWWELTEWDSQAEPAAAPAPEPRTWLDDSPERDRRIAWQGAVHDAARVLSGTAIPLARLEVAIRRRAEIFYRIIIAGPPGHQDGADSEGDGAPDDVDTTPEEDEGSAAFLAAPEAIPEPDVAQMIQDSVEQWNADLKAGVRPGTVVSPIRLERYCRSKYATWPLETLSTEQALELATKIATGGV